MNDLKGSKILVIGGAGFIGSHVVSELLKEDVEEVVIYDNFARGKMRNIEKSLNDPRCYIYPDGGDIRDIDICSGYILDVNKIVCLAAVTINRWRLIFINFI